MDRDFLRLCGNDPPAGRSPECHPGIAPLGHALPRDRHVIGVRLPRDQTAQRHYNLGRLQPECVPEVGRLARPLPLAVKMDPEGQRVCRAHGSGGVPSKLNPGTAHRHRYDPICHNAVALLSKSAAGSGGKGPRVLAAPCRVVSSPQRAVRPAGVPGWGVFAEVFCYSWAMALWACCWACSMVLYAAISWSAAC